MADKAHASFSPDPEGTINYAMTSFLTTGGIQAAGRKSWINFIPRSFNMGIRRDVYGASGRFFRHAIW